VYDPATNRWSQTGSMDVGRWYPSLVTLGDGKVFVASGVEKLVKPVYPDHLADSLANVRKTETYDPASGDWSDNGGAAERSLPLFPRLHLLPNGHVYYNAAGQAFNPFGQAWDEALWNVAASYDPATGRWKDLGIPGAGGGLLGGLLDLDFGQPVSDLARLGIPGGGKSLALPGFRGSTFSVMLPLQPDLFGRYTKASFLTADGVLNPPSPGSYLSTSDSRITTVDTERGDAITTPTGDHISLPGGFAPNERDPSFEIYSPPYLFRGARPRIVSAPSEPAYGATMEVAVDRPATEIESVVLVRNPSQTHVVDGDQRSVVLRVLGRSGNRLTVAAPPNGNVAPPGPYMLFVNRRTGNGPVPSVAAQLTLD
jgi:Domain of unknown function (DUF1929)